MTAKVEEDEEEDEEVWGGGGGRGGALGGGRGRRTMSRIRDMTTWVCECSHAHFMKTNFTTAVRCHLRLFTLPPYSSSSSSSSFRLRMVYALLM